MAPGMKSLTTELTNCRNIPALFWIVVPVLVVRMHAVQVLPEAAYLYPVPALGDTRSWWKAVCICGIGLWMVFHFAIRLCTGWRPRHVRFAGLIGAAAIVTLISAFTSEYPMTSWLGYTTFYEGAAVLLSYLIAMCYIAEMTDKENARVALIRTMGVIGLINGFHGIAEGFGWHFWQSDVGAWLMGASPGAVRYTFSGTNIAYGTVFQPNHYGTLMAMLGALALGMCFFEKSRLWRIFWVGATLATFAGLVFSQARVSISAYLGIAAIFFIHHVLKAIRSASGVSGLRRYASPGFVCGIIFCGIVAMLLFGSPAMRATVRRIIQRSQSLSVDSVQKTTQIQAVGLQDNRIYIRLSDQTLLLRRRLPDTWTIQAEGDSTRGTALLFGEEDKSGWRSAVIPGITGGTLLCRSQGNIRLRAPDTNLDFYARGVRLWIVDTNNRQLYASMPLSLAASITGFEGFLSARGYIWTRIWPSIRKHLFFGSGPGTFALSDRKSVV